MLHISAPQLKGADNKPSYVFVMGDRCDRDLMVVDNGLPCDLPLRFVSALVGGEWVKTLDFNLLFPQVWGKLTGQTSGMAG